MGKTIRKNAASAISTLILSAMILISSSCSGRPLKIEISNTCDFDRVAETVEIPLESILGERSGLSAGFIILNAGGTEQSYQITSDRTVIFTVEMKAQETKTFTVRKGIPAVPETVACGRIYPARLEDLAWENDKIGFRAYGPKLQKRGDKAYGYDLFAKRDADYPVLEKMYELETDAVLKAKIRELRKTDPEKAQELQNAKSYHIDKGHGMDCYAVGPTLGAGTAALIDNKGEIVYPWCYEKCEILDNGPLRFKVKLTFTPMEADGRKDIVETRYITLDAGAHLNKTQIFYSGIDQEKPIVSGIVLHDDSNAYCAEAEKGYISYQDPTTGPGKGLLYIGSTTGHSLDKAGTQYFSEEESAARNKAKGHVLAWSTYSPQNGFTYWWGFGWSKSDMETFEDWNNYMDTFSKQLRNPLSIRIR